MSDENFLIARMVLRRTSTSPEQVLRDELFFVALFPSSRKYTCAEYFIVAQILCDEQLFRLHTVGATMVYPSHSFARRMVVPRRAKAFFTIFARRNMRDELFVALKLVRLNETLRDVFVFVAQRVKCSSVVTIKENPISNFL